MPRFVTAAVLLLIAAQLIAADNDALNRSIQNAIDDPTVPFRLDVYCSNKHGRRSLVVYRGAVAVWKGERQVRLSAEDRRQVLRLLRDSGFSGFKARYGEQRKAEKQEAPLRVSCRVSVVIDGNHKTSVQLLEGAQSPDLLGLAGGLLDWIEPRTKTGVAATSLEDGLKKLADAAIASEVLELRLLQLTEGRGSGFILQIVGGEISRQAYAPGKAIGDIESWPIDTCSTRTVISVLLNAQAWNLPTNLRHSGTTEFDVAVLGFRHYVRTSPTFRNADPDALVRFERMIRRLEDIASECPAVRNEVGELGTRAAYTGSGFSQADSRHSRG